MHIKRLVTIAGCLLFLASMSVYSEFFSSLFKKKATLTQQEAVHKFETYSMNQSNTYRIVLVQGDLFNLNPFINSTIKSPLETYTIVNAANQVLQLGGGIAGIIKTIDTSGTVQKKCDAILKQYGQNGQFKKSTGFLQSKTYHKTVPIGSAWLTSSGDLLEKNKIAYIVHAVGPNCQKSSSQEERTSFEDFLRMTYGSLFKAVLQHNGHASNQPTISTIACPSLSTGIFSCDLIKAAQACSDAIFNYMHMFAQYSEEYTSTAPTTFIMVAFDDKDYTAYKKAFDAMYKALFPLQNS